MIRSVAEAASVRIVDPLADGRLAEDEGLVAEDDVHLTAAGQAALADLVASVVEEASPGPPASERTEPPAHPLGMRGAVSRPG